MYTYMYVYIYIYIYTCMHIHAYITGARMMRRGPMSQTLAKTMLDRQTSRGI